MKKRTKLVSFAALGLSLAITISSFNGQKPVSAASDKYLEDFIVIDAAADEEAQTKVATLDGYTLVDGTLFKKEGLPNAKYVACKFTNEAKKALTDIRAMNMMGGFSCEAYEKALEERKDKTDIIVDQLYDSVEALKNGYATSKANKATKGVDGILYAYDLLSYYTYDDLKHDDGTAYTVAELMTSNLSESDLKEHLNTIFLQGNSNYVAGIEMALMHAACSSTGALDLDSLAENDVDYNDYTGSEFSYCEDSAAYMAAGVETIQGYLRPYTNGEFAKEATENNAEEYQKELKEYLSNTSEDNKSDFYLGAFTHLAMSSFSYHYNDGTVTLADFFLSLDSDDIDNTIFYPFAAGLNDAQIGCLPYAGFDTLIVASLIKKLTDRAIEQNDDFKIYNYIETGLLEKGGSDTKISVFEGVDRSVFEAEGVALTNDALRQNNSKNDFNWFADEQASKAKVADLAKTILAYSSLTVLVAGLISTLSYWYVHTNVVDSIAYFAPKFATWGIRSVMSMLMEEVAYAADWKLTDIAITGFGNCIQVSVAKSMITLASVGLKIISFFGVVTVLAIATLIVALAIYFIWNHLSEQPVDYVDIPEIMVDEEIIDDEAVYSNYYVVKDETGKAQSTTFYEERGETQWVALYKTTDTNRGNPILAKDLRLTGMKSGDNEADYTAVRKFGETSKYNMQRFYGNGYDSLYLGYKTEEPSNTGSIFSSNIGLPIICAFLGLVVGAAGGILSFKAATKKKKEE